MIKGYAAASAGSELKVIEYKLEELAADEVEIEVLSCGLCHSDLSMLDDDWGRTTYPFVPGHEIIGRVIATGASVPTPQVGQLVGVGWYAGSCMTCNECRKGELNLCTVHQEETIVGRHGGFAERVRCRWQWAVPLPEGLDPVSAGPLFCGGITVFSPIVTCGVQPTDRVGVVGIGGLGHMALQFLRAWGCEVVAFSSNPEKSDAALSMGAHRTIDSTSPAALDAAAGSFDFILVTVNVGLDWNRYLNALKPHGKLHFVGAVLEPVPVPVFSLIGQHRQISGSPLGSPATVDSMLSFCVRHSIKPVCETFPMSRINDAFEHLKSGKARYRIVLESDWA